jgi:glyceraldehyde 3-phosphate dehydrogenase
MLKPILDNLTVSNLLTASMSTVHAVTNSQSVLDTVRGANAKDLPESRSILNNVILTSTNAAAALAQVLPEVADIGFIADSVRIAEVAANDPEYLLRYSDEQNVSADVKGMKAGVVIEGTETYTRTSFVNVDLTRVTGLGTDVIEALEEPVI